MAQRIIGLATWHCPMRHGGLIACTCKSNCLYMYKQLLGHDAAKNMLCDNRGKGKRLLYVSSAGRDAVVYLFIKCFLPFWM